MAVVNRAMITSMVNISRLSSPKSSPMLMATNAMSARVFIKVAMQAASRLP